MVQELDSLLTGKLFWPLTIGTIAVLAAALVWLLVWRITRLRFASRQITNWRLALLIVTGIVLSIASGWTTWDGMRNFTSEPVLSLLITFGIQAVLLVVSWLIGESFANGLQLRASRERARGSDEPVWLMRLSYRLAAFIVLAIVALVGLTYGPELLEYQLLEPDAASRVSTISAVGIPILLVFLVLLVSGRVVFDGFLGSLRVMAANVTLWVMFIACLAASVFFSYDSLFSHIFPADERARAALVRTRSQVAQIVRDVEVRTQQRLNDRRRELFASTEWRDYTTNVANLTTLADRAPAELQALAQQNYRARRQNLARLESELASANFALQRIQNEADSARRSIEALRSERQSRAARVTDLESKAADMDRQIAAKAVEAEQEENGFGTTGVEGRGPRYREITREQRALELDRKQIANDLDLARGRLTEIAGRISSAEDKQAEITSRVANQSVKVNTSKALTASLREPPQSGGGSDQTSLDAPSQARTVGELRNTFERQPTEAHLVKLEQACTRLTSTLAGVDKLRSSLQPAKCETDLVGTTAGPVFALSAGLAGLAERCTAEGKLTRLRATDALLGFARECIQTSRLTTDEGLPYYDRLNAVALNRDDKAHRFVVTINAFADANRLAFLALAIALAIDGLVFMSGLFGAYAARSPLSDLPNNAGRSARQLEGVVESALLPDLSASALLALELLQPRPLRAGSLRTNGWTHEVGLRALPFGSRRQIGKLLNAGATIDAVQAKPDTNDVFLVRSELVEYLTRLARTAPPTKDVGDSQDQLGQLLMRVFSGQVSDNAAIVRSYLQPIPKSGEFSSLVSLSDVATSHVELVRNALNAAATMNCVRFPDDDRNGTDTYYVHKDFFGALTELTLLATDDSGDGTTTMPGQLELLDFAKPDTESSRLRA